MPCWKEAPPSAGARPALDPCLHIQPASVLDGETGRKPCDLLQRRFSYRRVKPLEGHLSRILAEEWLGHTEFSDSSVPVTNCLRGHLLCGSEPQLMDSLTKSMQQSFSFPETGSCPQGQTDDSAPSPCHSSAAFSAKLSKSVSPNSQGGPGQLGYHQEDQTPNLGQ